MTLNVGWLLEPSSHSARISFASASEVAQGMGGETTPAPAGYPTVPDPTLIG